MLIVREKMWTIFIRKNNIKCKTLQEYLIITLQVMNHYLHVC